MNETMPKKSLRKKIPLLFLLLLAAGTPLLWQLPASKAEEKTQTPTQQFKVPVEVQQVLLQPTDQEIFTVGTLQSNESVILRSEIAGRLVRFSFSEGETVSKGDVLFSLDRSVLQAQLDQAEAGRALSQANYKRAEALLKDRAIAQQERDEAYAQWQLDEASVRLAKAQLDKTILRAPFGGTLGLRQVSIGDYIQPGQNLVNLEDTSKLKVEFRIPEVHAPLMQVGQKIVLSSNAWPDRSFEGHIYAIDPQVNETSRSLVARGILDNHDALLRPGQFVQLALVVGHTEEALFVPEQAIVPQPKRQYVWTLNEGAAHMTEVTLGKRLKGLVEIRSGLQPDDVVITGGLQKIAEGVPVHPVPADPELFAQQEDTVVQADRG